jgi:hypothetical protein
MRNRIPIMDSCVLSNIKSISSVIILVFFQSQCTVLPLQQLFPRLSIIYYYGSYIVSFTNFEQVSLFMSKTDRWYFLGFSVKSRVSITFNPFQHVFERNKIKFYCRSIFSGSQSYHQHEFLLGSSALISIPLKTAAAVSVVKYGFLFRSKITILPFQDVCLLFS